MKVGTFTVLEGKKEVMLLVRNDSSTANPKTKFSLPPEEIFQLMSLIANVSSL